MGKSLHVTEAIVSGNKEKQRALGRAGGLARARKRVTEQAIEAAFAERATMRRDAERAYDDKQANYDLIPPETYV